MRAGRIRIDLSAGTADFDPVIDKSGAKLRDFGAAAGRTKAQLRDLGDEAKRTGRAIEGAVTARSATSGVVRVAGGQLSIRAAETFLSGTLGLGSFFEKIFPVVGGIAVLGIFDELISRSSKLYEAFKKFQEAPQRIAQEFNSLNQSASAANDELDITNARLANEIAKLEGKPQNALAESLAEAKKNADDLASSLQKDIEQVVKLLKEESLGSFKGFFTDTAPTSDILDRAKKLQNQLVSIDVATRRELRTTTDPTKQQDILKGSAAQRRKIIDTEIKGVSGELDAAQSSESERNNRNPGKVVGVVSGVPIYSNGGPTPPEQQQRINSLSGYLDNLLEESERFPKEEKKENLTGRLKKDQALNDAAALTRPYQDKINELDAQLEGLKSQLASIGKAGTAEVLAKSWTEAREAIANLNDELAKHRQSLTLDQQVEIVARFDQINSIKAEEEWKQKLQQTTVSIQDRIQSLKLLTSAIGEGYESQKKAAVQQELFQALGKDKDKLNDETWLNQKDTVTGQTHRQQIQTLQSTFGLELDAQRTEQTAKRLDQLHDQIELENSLAVAQARGAEATRTVTLAYQLKKIAEDGGLVTTQEAIEKEIALSEAEGRTVDVERIRQAIAATSVTSDEQSKTKDLLSKTIEANQSTQTNQTRTRLAELNEQIRATERLTAAQLGGADAVRKAQLQNQIEEIKRTVPADVLNPKTGQSLQQEQIQKVTQLSEVEHQKQIVEDALKTGISYQNQLGSIDRQISALETLKATQGDNLAIETSLKKLEQERATVFAQQVEVIGSARDGMRAFFAEMATEGSSAAKIVHDALKSTFDDLNSTLAKLITDTGSLKQEWASFFKGLSHELTTTGLKQLEASLSATFTHPGQTKPGTPAQISPGSHPHGIAGTLASIFLGGKTQAGIVAKRDGNTPGTALFVSPVNPATAGNPAPAAPGRAGTPASATAVPVPAGAVERTPSFHQLAKSPATQGNILTDLPYGSGSHHLILRQNANEATLGGTANINLDDLSNLGNFNTSELNQLSQTFAGFRATGGDVSGKSSYIVGEKGPELFVPDSDGTIIPNTRLRSPHGFPVLGEIASSITDPSGFAGLFAHSPTHSPTVPQSSATPQPQPSTLARLWQGFTDTWDITSGPPVVKRYAYDISKEEVGKAQDSFRKGDYGMALGHMFAAIPGTGFASDVVGAQMQLGQRAGKEFQQGRYLDSGVDEIAAIVPLLGPNSVSISDKLKSGQRGDPAQGIGQLLGFAAAGFLPLAGAGTALNAAGEVPALAKAGEAVRNHPAFQALSGHTDTLDLIHKAGGIEWGGTMDALLDETGSVGPGSGLRSLRARSAYKPSTQAKQAIADESEASLAKALGIPRTSGNAPFDLQNERFGIEVKTLVDNGNDKITMHPESLQRKLATAEDRKLNPWTVVVDKRGPKPEYYYRPGLGSFRIGAMTHASSLRSLKSILLDETGSVGAGSGLSLEKLAAPQSANFEASGGVILTFPPHTGASIPGDFLTIAAHPAATGADAGLKELFDFKPLGTTHWPADLETKLAAYKLTPQNIVGYNLVRPDFDNPAQMNAVATYVSEDFRRQSVATKMYDAAETAQSDRIGKSARMSPSLVLSDDAKAFWSSRTAAPRLNAISANTGTQSGAPLSADSTAAFFGALLPQLPLDDRAARTNIFGDSFSPDTAYNSGDILSTLISRETGKPFSGFRAAGGEASSDSSYVVGENGPELFVPESDGTIVPNQKLKDFRGFDKTQSSLQLAAIKDPPKQLPVWFPLLSTTIKGLAGMAGAAAAGADGDSGADSEDPGDSSSLDGGGTTSLDQGDIGNLGDFSNSELDQLDTSNIGTAPDLSADSLNSSFGGGSDAAPSSWKNFEQSLITTGIGIASGLLVQALTGPHNRHQQPGHPYTVPDFNGAFADGGPVKAGKTHLVGEKGRELFISHQTGSGSFKNVFGGSTATFAAAPVSHTSLSSINAGLPFGGHREMGGGVDPGYSYVVGEAGPEVWTPPSSGGTILPTSALRPQQADGGPNVFIDARNADPALMDQKVRRGMEAAGNVGVRTSFRTVQEFQKRTPQIAG